MLCEKFHMDTNCLNAWLPKILSEHCQTWPTCVPVTGHSKEAGIIDVTSWQVSTHRENGVLAAA